MSLAVVLSIGPGEDTPREDCTLAKAVVYRRQQYVVQEEYQDSICKRVPVVRYFSNVRPNV